MILISETALATQPIQSSQLAMIFSGLSARQAALLGSTKWDTLNFTQQTTYAAVTHALEHTRLTDGSSALDLVAAITDIEGRVIGASPPKQYNIAVLWRADAVSELTKVGFGERAGWGHKGEWGVSYHGGPLGLHCLFSKAIGVTGHIHVDYRNFGLYVWRGRPEGHFGPEDANVMAVGPEKDVLTGRLIDNLQRHALWFSPIPGLLH